MRLESFKGFYLKICLLALVMNGLTSCQGVDSQIDDGDADELRNPTDEQGMGVLDGVVMQYTYSSGAAVRTSYKNGILDFEWLAGAQKGRSGGGYQYRAREIGSDRYLVNWHEPETLGFVTLYVDIEARQVFSSILSRYGTENEQIYFDTATIDDIRR